MNYIAESPDRVGRALRPRVAFVHEWFTTYAGSEKVLEAMLDEYPDADLFALIDFMPPEIRRRFRNKPVRTSFLQRIPGIRKNYRSYLGLMPLAVAQFDLSGYDLVISNSHAVAKGIITGPDQLHICYCYSPMRYAWDLQHQYLDESNLRSGIRSMLTRWVLHRMRIWDVQSAHNVDQFIACSQYIARRVKKAYRRDASVIYPNVAVDEFTIGSGREDFYLAASRVVPYKKMQMIVEAFSRMPDRRLVVIGDGPSFQRMKSVAGPNVQLRGHQPQDVLLAHMQKARAFIFAAEEDFGITPLEAQACGTPVLAFGRGGAVETVLDGITGLHFHEQSPEAVCEVVRRFESMSGQFDPERIRAHAQSFSTQRFRGEFRKYVEAAWDRHQSALRVERDRAPMMQPEILLESVA